MELPDHYLPSLPCPYKLKSSCKGSNHRRLMFAEYGAYQSGNLDVDEETKDIKFWPQKGQQKVTGLSSALATIPLCDQPLESQWISKDRILGVSNFKETTSKMISAIWRLPHLKAQIQRDPALSDSVNLCINALSKMDKDKRSFDRCMAVLREKLPTSVNIVYEKLQELGQAYNSNCWSGYNRDFYGGLIAHAATDNHSTEHLVHVKGEKLNEICLSEVCSDNGTGLKYLNTASSLSTSSVFQLCASNTSGGKALVCARESCGCRLYSFDDSLRLEEKKNIDLDEVVSSVCFSPYLENEILISSPKGSLYLWDIKSRVSPQPLGKNNKKSIVLEPWSTSFYGGHPRHIVVADNFSVHMSDHRSKFRNSVKLFALSESLTKGEEQLMAACSIGFPYFSAATDVGLFLLDSRFPGSPVLNWSTEMMNPPQYLLPWPAQGGTNSCSKLLFLASQQPAEVMCFPVDVSSSRPPTAPVLPWKVSRIDQFSRDFSTINKTLQKRFEFSLAGFTVSPTSPEGSFTVYQLDSCGDVFYQTFNPDSCGDPSGSENCSNAEGENSLQIFKQRSRTQEVAAQARVERWLAALESQSLAAVASAMSLSCESEKVCAKNLRPYSTLVSEIFSCDFTSEEQSEQDQVSHTQVDPDQPHKNLSKLSGLLYKRSCQTQLLLALRDGKDIKELLRKREVRHMQLRLEKRRKILRQERQARRSSTGPKSKKKRKEKQSRESGSAENARNEEGEKSHGPVAIRTRSSLSETAPPIGPNQHSEDPLADMPDNSHGDRTGESDEAQSQMPFHSNTVEVMRETLEPHSPTLYIPRIGTPSLFSSSSSSSSYSPSASSSSSSLSYSEERAVKQEGINEDVVPAETSHQPEPLPYHNVISWLLQSGSSRLFSKTSPEKRSQHPTTVQQSASGKESKSPALADIIQNTNIHSEKNVDDLASICSSQRSNTLSRPELRRIVDPSLSGFLSSPKRTIPVTVTPSKPACRRRLMDPSLSGFLSSSYRVKKIARRRNRPK